MRIRKIREQDVPVVAGLAGQLGYSTDTEAMASRLRELAASSTEGVFAAVDDLDEVVGWIHIGRRVLLESGPFAEILGLIVDGGRRGCGIGAALARALAEAGADVAVADRDPQTAQRTAAELAAARAVIRERLAPALDAVPVRQARTWVGVAGTFTTIAALAYRLPVYDSAAIHLSRVPFSDLLQVCEELIGMTRRQRAALGPMHEGRVDVIGGGALVVQELAAAIGERAGITELVVSEHDILDGIALAIP